jgi:hypothetical protein
MYRSARIRLLTNIMLESACKNGYAFFSGTIFRSEHDIFGLSSRTTKDMNDGNGMNFTTGDAAVTNSAKNLRLQQELTALARTGLNASLKASAADVMGLDEHEAEVGDGEGTNCEHVAEHHGKGPELVMHWGNIDDDWKPQYTGGEGSFTESVDEGAGDVFSGNAPYEFGSVIHCPVGSAYDTNPHENKNLMGNHAARSAHDIEQANDRCQEAAVSQSSTPPPYTGGESSFTESVDEGAGDVFSGNAPYDFGIVIHCPVGSAYDTNPHENKNLMGSRSPLRA